MKAAELPKAAVMWSGGDLPGACFHTGVAETLALDGFEPHAMAGVSAGAIVTAFLADRLGRGLRFFQAAAALRHELETLRGPDDLVDRRGLFTLIKTLFSPDEWPGLVTLDPLRRRLLAQLDLGMIRRCPIQIAVGAYNLDRGEMRYVTPSDPNFLTFVLASASVPGITPSVVIEDATQGPERWCDGGVRDIAPVYRFAGTESALLVCPQPATLAPWRRRGTLFSLLGRVTAVVTHETLENDLQLSGEIDRAEATGPASGRYEILPKMILRGQREFDVDMLHFAPSDVLDILGHGRVVARTEQTLSVGRVA